MKIGSYNILDDELALFWKTPEGYLEERNSEGVLTQKSNWEERKFKLLKNVDKSKNSVVCLQEMSQKSWELFKNRYLITPVSFHNIQHGVSIAYSGKVLLISYKMFRSLNDSRGEIYADFVHRKTNMRFRIASVHLKGYDYHACNKEASKISGLAQLREIVAEIHKDSSHLDYLFIAGDFNEDENEFGTVNCRLNFLKNHHFHHDSSANPTEKRTNRKIDWIFYKQMNPNKKAECIPCHFPMQDLSASDHYIIGLKIKPTV